MAKVGILHPGRMGVAVAKAMQDSVNQVALVSEGRSQASSERATQNGLLRG